MRLEKTVKITALIVSAAILVAAMPFGMMIASSQTEKSAYPSFDPYTQFIQKSQNIEREERTIVDYSGLDFSVFGSYYSSQQRVMNSTLGAIGVEDIYISEDPLSDPGGHYNNSNFICSETYGDAIGSRQATNAGGGLIRLEFTAPSSGEYIIVPQEIAEAGGKSMYLTSPQRYADEKAEYFTQSFTVRKDENVLFTETLTLDNFNSVGADIPDDITVALAEGEKLTFEFEAGENWGRTDLYVNFIIKQISFASDAVESVYFEKSSYIVCEKDSLNIAPVIVPSTAANKVVEYSVEDKEILSVDENGNITPKKAGYTKVTVTTADGGHTADTLVGIYAENSPEYTFSDNYEYSINEFGSPSGSMSIDNSYGGAWNAMYKTADGFKKTEKISYEPWGGTNFGICYYPESGNYYGSYGSVLQYKESGKLITQLTYGRQDTTPHGVAVEFTADEYGIYSLMPSEESDMISLSPSAQNYVSSDSHAALEKFNINFYHNDSKIKTITLSKDKIKEEFPVINSIEMQKDDTLLIELETGVWEKGEVLISPKMVKVLNEKPVQRVTSLKLDKESLSLSEDESYTLIATVLPENAGEKGVVFSSSDEKIVTVDKNGTVKAVGIGNAVITAESKDNSEIKATCAVSVKGASFNLINPLWDSVLGSVTEKNKPTRYNYSGEFSAGVLGKEGYADFEYAVNQGWGNPNAILLTNSSQVVNSPTQALAIYNDNGSDIAEISSYTDGTWVYAGYNAKKDGVYKIKPSANQSEIKLIHASYCTFEDIISWNEDKPFYVRITKNGEEIWPLNGSMGVELSPGGSHAVAMPELDNIKLYKGDTIRVEVSGQSGITSHHAAVTLDFDVEIQGNIEVQIPVTDVRISEAVCELSIGEEYRLSASVLPENADNKNIMFISSDPETVLVSPVGKLTALRQGSAVIYAVSSENGEIKQSCNVTVTSFEIKNYTPDELKDSLYKQLNGKIVVNSFAVETDTNWSAQTLNKDNVWEPLQTITTYDWKNTNTVSAYAFRKSSEEGVGLEGINGYYQPYVQTDNSEMAMCFTATLSGSYIISADLRNQNIKIPETYVNGKILPADKNKEYEFAIYVNESKMYSVKLSANNYSVAFPELKNIFLNAKDTVRFVIKDNPDSKSPIYIYFSPVISLIKPDSVRHAPIAEDKEYYISPDTTFSGKINAIHPNGYSMTFEILDANPNAQLSIADDGSFSYIPIKGYKGIDERRVKISDKYGKSCIVKLKLIVCETYDATDLFSEALLAADGGKASGKIIGMSFGESIWRFQYTYDGLTYANGFPKYFDTDTAENIVNAGWWGYNAFSTDMPQALVSEFEGVAAIQIMAGDKPWGTNPIGALTFIAPNDATYLIKGSDAFDKIKLNADLSKDTFKQPVNVWISKNGKKIWPQDSEGISLSRSLTEVHFPELKVAMKKGETLRVCVSGHYENERQNLVVIAPIVYDIGSYDLSLDPNTEPEGGKVIIDDDGEPIVKYSSFSMKKPSVSGINAKLQRPVTDKKSVVNKKVEIISENPFEIKVSFEKSKEAELYIVLVYSRNGEEYELHSKTETKELNAVISGLGEGEFTVQIIAADKYGQYIEVYRPKNFSVSKEGKISVDMLLDLKSVIIVAGISIAAVLVLAVGSVIILKRRKGIAIK